MIPHWKYDNLENLLLFNQIGIVKSKKDQSPDNSYAYLKMDSIGNDNSLLNIELTRVNATEKEVVKFSLSHHDFLFNTRNSFELVGKSCLYEKRVDHPVLLNNNIMRMRFKDILLPKFVSYAFSSHEVRQQLEIMKSGTTGVVGIYYKSLKTLELPIPPIEEQKQIIQILDEAFSAINKAKANIEKNIENAKELFQSKLNETFSQKDDSWEENTLINLNKFIDYRGKTPKKTDSGIPLITAKNVRMGYVKKDPQEYIAIEAYDDWMTRGTPSKGDVLFTTEAPLANVALLDTDDKIALAQRIITLCPDREVLTGKFLCYCLQSKIIQDKILSKGTGATVTGIKSKLLKEIIVPYPSLNEQRSITTFLDQLKDSSNSLTKYYAAKLRDLDELKKSILQRAFSGELTNKAQVA